MIELRNDALVFSFPDVHRDAVLSIDFQRTLRIPDDDREYPLPPGIGRFPVRHVDDYAARVPERWLSHGGVMLPMYQSEAMWLNFASSSGYMWSCWSSRGWTALRGARRDPPVRRDAARQWLQRGGAAHGRGGAAVCRSSRIR